MREKNNALEKEFSICNHIWFIKKGERDSKHCIKCGLTDEVFYDESIENSKLMKKYILNHTGTLIKGKKIEVDFDYDIIKIIYESIRKKKSDIDDDTIKKYIKI